MQSSNDIVSRETEMHKTREINTYDLPISPIKSNNESDIVNDIPEPIQTRKILFGLYKFIATVTVILALIFSATDMIDFFVSEINTGDALVKRIFGKNASSSSDFFELIINQSFGNAFTNTEPPLWSDSVPPPSSSPIYTSPQHSSSLENPPSDPPSTQAPETIPPSELPQNAHPIISMDMSLLSYGKNFIYNSTSLSPDISSLSSSPFKKIYTSDGPLVRDRSLYA